MGLPVASYVLKPVVKMTCKNCGECCASVCFTEQERYLVRKITRKLNLRWRGLVLDRPGEPTQIVYLPYTLENTAIVDRIKDFRELDATPDIPCPFLQYNKSGQTQCACYEDRPDICRRFGDMGNVSKFFFCENYGKKVV